MASEMVSFKANGHTCPGYLSIPESGQGPGLIVIQEYWGLVDHIKDIADRFAAAGFVALAPDLYHGESTKAPDQAGKLMMALNIAQTEKDLGGAITFLTNHEACTSQKVGTVGFCMGGQLSLYAACLNSSVGACVDFYGIHPNVEPPLNQLKAPLLGFFAGKDEFVAPSAVTELETKLEAANIKFEFHKFEDADHAFFNDARPEVFHLDHANYAWDRMNAFFKEHLGS